MRLQVGVVVRLLVSRRLETMRVVKIGSNGQMFFAPHNEANVDARNRDKNNSFNYVSKLAGSLRKAEGRRVTVSPIGELRDPGFRG